MRINQMQCRFFALTLAISYFFTFGGKLTEVEMFNFTDNNP